MIEIGHFKFKFRRYDFISHQNSMRDKLFNTSEVDEDNMFLQYLLLSENVDNIFHLVRSKLLGTTFQSNPVSQFIIM